METCVRTSDPRRHPALGNFLSGMETDGVNVTFWYRRDLGNFLSGMETRGNAVHTALFIINLGNFLSGMETDKAGRGVGDHAGPWKLP